MKLKEYQGKAIFKKNGIRIQEGFPVNSVDEIQGKLSELDSSEYVIKAQVLVGGRGKSGGVKFATKEDIEDVAKSILGMDLKGEKVDQILVCEKLDFLGELYVSIVVNRVEKGLTLIVSLEGGVDIEELAKTSPSKVIKMPMSEFSPGSLMEKLKGFEHATELVDIVEKLAKSMVESDAELVEINPLAITPKGLVAADSKVIIDDNALFRHPEFTSQKESELTPIEKEANKAGVAYVELDGNIAIIGNGAGLVMATLDAIGHYGGKPANFLDVGGGASVEKMEKSLEICMKKDPKGIFINIFGGITRCDNIAQGLVDYISKNEIKIPMVVRLIGTNEAEGQKILTENKIDTLATMGECAEKIVSLVK